MEASILFESDIDYAREKGCLSHPDGYIKGGWRFPTPHYISGNYLHEAPC